MNHTSIMLIDDDEDDRDIFFQAIIAIDPSYKFSGFEKGSDALILLNDSETILPDLIFLDLNMPGMNGFECLKKIREIIYLKNTPVFIYSTAAKLENENFNIYQPVHFLSKPIKFDEIVEALRIIINNHQMESKHLK